MPEIDIDWLDDFEQPTVQFAQQVNYDLIATPVPKQPKDKVTLTEPDRTLNLIDRRIKSDGNITETFPQNKVETSHSRTENSYQEILSKSVQLLAKYRAVVTTMGTDS